MGYFAHHNFTPGGLRGTDVEVLQRMLQDLNRLAPGQFRTAAPLCHRDDVCGLSIWLDQSALFNQPTTISNTTWTFSDDSVTFSGGTLNVDALDMIFSGSASLTFNNTTINTSSITLNGQLTFNGTFPIVFENPVEICGYQFWCCDQTFFTSSNTEDWALPGPATVYVIVDDASAVNTTLQSIVPANIGDEPGPQIIAIVNSSSTTVTIANDGTFSTGAPILLPPAYGDSLTLQQNDAIILWYDACSTQDWRVLACTVEWFACRSQSGTFNYRPKLNLISADTTTLTITQADDAANNETSVTFTASGGGSASLGSAWAGPPSDYSITSSLTSIGFTLSLPAAGTYLLFAKAMVGLRDDGTISGAWIDLFDSTNSNQIPHTTMCAYSDDDMVGVDRTVSMSTVYTVAGATNVVMRAAMDGTYTTATIFKNDPFTGGLSPGDLTTGAGYVKIA